MKKKGNIPIKRIIIARGFLSNRVQKWVAGVNMRLYWEKQLNFPNVQNLIKSTPGNDVVKMNQQVWKYYSQLFLLM